MLLLAAVTVLIVLAVGVCISPALVWRATSAKYVGNTRVIEHSRMLGWINLEGLALWPCVFVAGVAVTKKGAPTTTLLHEQIHIAQQRECWVLPFYLGYVLEFFYRKWTTADEEDPYERVSFEAEAYAYEEQPDYLLHRPRFAWVRFL